MKEQFTCRKMRSSILSLGTFIVLSSFQMLYAQSYTYATESFEDAAWSSASSSSNPIVSETGTWTVAKNNIQTNAYAQDETYSLIIATKTDALITPSLDEGAGTLTYYANKPAGGGRTITVLTSTNLSDWSAAVTIENAFSVPAVWTERSIEINDPAVRYIKFSTNSNGGVYLDNIKITKSGVASSIDKTDMNKTIVKKQYYDLFGKQVNVLEKNTIYIQENIYEDGSMTRIKTLDI